MDEHVPPYILTPSDKIRTFWNVVTILMMFYVAIYLPYFTAFINEVQGSASYYLDISVDIIFAIDVVLTFFSAYEEADGSMQY